MIYQISSGQGPVECELAVAKFLSYLQKHYHLMIIDTSKGYYSGTFRSVRFSSSDDLSEYIGSIQWICQSIYRPGHKRKNWFIDFSECITQEIIEFDEKQVKYETFHSGGNGGQNVNKVETGVRAIYLPTGFSAYCTNERSQLLNKQKALKRLKDIIQKHNRKIKADNTNSTWQQHTKITRGNAAHKFNGAQFIPIANNRSTK